jgi:hypothetical protein
MAAFKRLNSDLTITNKINPTANITLSTNTVFIEGNLIVGGNSTSVNKTDMSISDNIINLNSGETGSGVTLLYSGINVDRGLAANVAIVWNEPLGVWTLTNDGTNYVSIATQAVLQPADPVVFALVL